VKAYEFTTQKDALDNAAALGGEAVLVAGRPMIVDQKTLDTFFDHLDFAYICDRDGEIAIIPAK